jgi:transcriptional regulator with XRE-family HTH domain
MVSDTTTERRLAVSMESRLREASERTVLVRAFGERLRALRVAAGLSPSDLADRCRLSASTISKAERGPNEVSLRMILILCDGLNVKPDALIDNLPTPETRRADAR